MPKPTKAQPRNAWEDTYFPDADDSDNVSDNAHVTVTESAHVSADVPAYDSVWRPVGVRVRGAELALLSTYAARERFKKGPLLTAVIQMLAAGEIDPDAIRARVRALRDADA